MDPKCADKLSQILDMIKDPLHALTVSSQNKERLLVLLQQGDINAIEEIYKDVPEATRDVLMRNIRLLMQLNAICDAFKKDA